MYPILVGCWYQLSVIFPFFPARGCHTVGRGKFKGDIKSECGTLSICEITNKWKINFSFLFKQSFFYISRAGTSFNLHLLELSHQFQTCLKGERGYFVQ